MELPSSESEFNWKNGIAPSSAPYSTLRRRVASLTESVAEDEAGRLQARRRRVDAVSLEDRLVVVDDRLVGQGQLRHVGHDALLPETEHPFCLRSQRQLRHVSHDVMMEQWCKLIGRAGMSYRVGKASGVGRGGWESLQDGKG